MAGRPLEETALAAGIAKANEIRRTLADLRQLVFTADPCPLPALEMMLDCGADPNGGYALFAAVGVAAQFDLRGYRLAGLVDPDHADRAGFHLLQRHINVNL